MATQFKLPDLGEDIEEAEVLKVLVSEGDTIALEQPVIEVCVDGYGNRFCSGACCADYQARNDYDPVQARQDTEERAEDSTRLFRPDPADG
ncbi:MAG: hypothetical protein IIB19_06995 [Chloroflexi bacterium]|nr:hypothetical protein [Chloroflexota bacterium]